MDGKEVAIVFTPGNEPYLGRELLFHFDQLICSVMEANASLAPTSHRQVLTDHQKMACQVIAQAISIALSIRELIRQGYLFGGHVLLRALAERAAILRYLHLYPAEIDKWNHGWEHSEAPSLAKMVERIQANQKPGSPIRGSDLTAPMNSLLHAKPDSAPWNLISIGEGGLGHAVSKILDRPDLCDGLCASAIPWLVLVQCMMAAYFADAPMARTDASGLIH
ncbi:MAG: hypothetical protein ABSD43_14810 [Terracidiphilus sp.]|jgi:hypothetical protein